MEKNNKKSNGVKTPKTKVIATLIAGFAVFAVTYFAMAENKSANSLFLDSDQDGLTNQEEQSLGTDPNSPDTDGDGYSDGTEIKSGYNPLKPAPGDQLLPNASAPEPKSAAPSPSDSESATASITPTDFPSASPDLSSVSLPDASVANSSNLQLGEDIPSDPNNLTNQVVNNFMKLTVDKSQGQSDPASDISYSPDDISQIIQTSISSANVPKELPEIRDDEMKILPPVDDAKLKPEEIKAKQKGEIEKYLSSLAFIFATSAPFPVDSPENLKPNLNTETDNLLSAVTGGDRKKIDFYAQKTRDGIEQIKKVDVPYVLKDVHKSALQLSIFALGLKDDFSAVSSDPMKSLAAVSSLQALADSALKLQADLQTVLDQYDIKSIEIKP